MVITTTFNSYFPFIVLPCSHMAFFSFDSKQFQFLVFTPLNLFSLWVQKSGWKQTTSTKGPLNKPQFDNLFRISEIGGMCFITLLICHKIHLANARWFSQRSQKVIKEKIDHAIEPQLCSKWAQAHFKNVKNAHFSKY